MSKVTGDLINLLFALSPLLPLLTSTNNRYC
ncbi:hypothetical protein cce_1002 [Crocosphaera subtropica ATCC 51142]|uniref:Uncharacterized protein n=1 Tax=Crocosphaera subtropica (strain ATCC 51142 / BH68) TaxID=43989 RepID=B1WT23_CROS5|nr:hypothetical protein cce_1002 [Crocosphaera subtropica ATCC 51142]